MWVHKAEMTIGRHYCKIMIARSLSTRRNGGEWYMFLRSSVIYTTGLPGEVVAFDHRGIQAPSPGGRLVERTTSRARTGRSAASRSIQGCELRRKSHTPTSSPVARRQAALRFWCTCVHQGGAGGRYTRSPYVSARRPLGGRPLGRTCQLVGGTIKQIFILPRRERKRKEENSCVRRVKTIRFLSHRVYVQPSVTCFCAALVRHPSAPPP